MPTARIHSPSPTPRRPRSGPEKSEVPRAGGILWTYGFPDSVYRVPLFPSGGLLLRMLIEAEIKGIVFPKSRSSQIIMLYLPCLSF